MALDPVTAGIGLVSKFVDKFIPDKDLAAKLKAQAGSQEFAGELDLLLGQLKINEVQAAHKSLFVAGSRPFIMWVCGFALAYSTIAHPILDIWFDMPVVDVSLLMPVMMGLLGLGGMRSFEKAKGVSREK
jgi:hypothetical protein